MEKHEVLAYCVMETFTEPVKPTNVKSVDLDGMTYINFNTALQSTNVRNRNGRTYIGDDLWSSIEQSPFVQELMKRKSWCGECGHPHTEDVKRILTIDPKLTSHRINNVWRVGNIIHGNVDTLLNFHGKQMANLIRQRLEVAFSLRALTKISKSGLEKVVRGRSHVVCYDGVILPSHPEAYMDTNDKIIMKNINDNHITRESFETPVFESGLIDYIKDESHNVKVISSIYDVIGDNMSISKDLKYFIVKEDSKEFYIKAEEKIKHDIMHYMKKI